MAASRGLSTVVDQFAPEVEGSSTRTEKQGHQPASHREILGISPTGTHSLAFDAPGKNFTAISSAVPARSLPKSSKNHPGNFPKLNHMLPHSSAHDEDTDTPFLTRSDSLVDQYESGRRSSLFSRVGYGTADHVATLEPLLNSQYPGGVNPSSRGENLATDPLSEFCPVEYSKHVVKGTSASEATELLDRNYAKRKMDYKKFFRQGRVFCTLSTEPLDDPLQRDDQFNTIVTYKVRFGQKVHSAIRRFLVVETDGRSCTCLPVISNGGKEYKKRDINLSHHGLIYSSRETPPRVDGITKQPLRLTLSPGADELPNPLYIHYGRVYTVETNVKVRDIGTLDDESKTLLKGYYREVQMDSFLDDEKHALPISPFHPQQRTFEAYDDAPGYHPNIGQHRFGDLPQKDSPQHNSPTISGYHTWGTYGSPTGYGSPQQQSERNPAKLPVEASNVFKATSSYPQYVSNFSHRPFDYEYQYYPLKSSLCRPGFQDDLQSNYRPGDEGKTHPNYRESTESSPFYTAAAELSPRLSIPDYCIEKGIKMSLDFQSDHIDIQAQVIGLSTEKASRSSSPNGMPMEVANGSTSRITTWLMDTEAVKNEASSRITVVSGPENLSAPGSPVSASSVESLASLVFSSIGSVSSKSSRFSQQDGAERFIALLSKDEQLQKLYKEASQKVVPEKFSANFKRCLVQCSVHLKAESEQEGFPNRQNSLQCAKAVRLYAEEAATAIGTIVRDGGHMAEAQNDGNLNNMMSYDSDSDDSLEALQNSKLPIESNVGDASGSLTLETTLESSVAFQLLKENLTLFLNPEPVKKALFKSWPVLHSRSLPLMIQYRISWLLPSFLRSHYDQNQSLRDILTITGQAQNSEAQSCGDYLINLWPEVGTLLLDTVQSLINGDPCKERKNEHLVLSLKLIDEIDELSTVAVAITAIHKIHVKAASAMSWLCAALRSSSSAKVNYSSTLIDATKSPESEPMIHIRLKHTEDLGDKQCCWYPLFPHTVVAKGFPVRARVAGKGLDISFGNMAMMGQSLNLVEHDGGFILEGLRTFLIPTALLFDGSVQWHLEPKRSGHSRKARKLFQVLRQEHLVNRYRNLDINDLIQRRCFLGWADEAQVIVATKTYSTREIGCSAMDVISRKARLKSHAITTGTEGMGFFGLTVNRTWLPVAVTSRLTLPQNKEILDTLYDEIDARVMVYDSGTKTAHILPQADMILLLAHQILEGRHQSLSDVQGEEIALRFASADVTAFEILQGSLGLQIFRGASIRNEAERCFGDLVKEIWNTLDMVENALVSNEGEWLAINRGAPKFLHGVEYVDIKGMKSSMSISQAEPNMPWVHLATTEPTLPVIFCRGLEQPIVPTRPDSLCDAWTQVPQGRNYLVATCATIYPWLDRQETSNGSRLSERIEWQIGPRATREGLITSHNDNKTSFVYHEQQLVIAKKASMNPRICDLVMGIQKGALIFGSSLIRKGCSKKLSRSVNMPNGNERLQICLRPLSHPSVLIDQQASEVPEGNSDTSAEVETSSSIDSPSITTSLSSSQTLRQTRDPGGVAEHSSAGPSTEASQCQSEYMVESRLQSSSSSDTRDRETIRGPRCIKRMGKSNCLRGIRDSRV
ncbi:hypothetical protein WAI453_012463 [Rhynchosporium graminicola]|uniref:DUF6590 domain-containing protein n=1 Tax=Rhynchosporium graminicola TaxID=2792576 RepID=A0A1E1LSM6_9HELO|nr:uncharacterized protein RCO7_09302 [Rhynchosporium commune]